MYENGYRRIIPYYQKSICSLVQERKLFQEKGSAIALVLDNSVLDVGGEM